MTRRPIPADPLTEPTAERRASPKRRVAHTAKRITSSGPELVIKDAERTRAEIIEVATKEFSRRGYSGGRINEIAERTRTSKRMIYYYFGSKEGLYKAVLFEHYRRLRENDRAASLEEKPPLEALAALTRLTFDWYVEHADEVPLVMVENIHHGKHVANLPEIGSLNSTATELVKSIYDRGVAQGVMRPGLRPIDIYISIASASFFNVSNRFTFKAIFGHDMALRDEIVRRREAVTEIVLRYVAVDPDRSVPHL
jgi:AcrR family transcriptional regulator